MPGLVVFGAVVTFALSLVLACKFLRMRCRRIGPPFGPRARPWAYLIVLSTAAVSTAVGLLFVAVSRHSGAVYIGILVSAGLLLIKLPPQRDRDLRPRTTASLLTLPFSRLYDRMGDDMQAWCDTRLEAARPKPQWIADAAQYYWAQMNRVRDQRHRANLDRWRDSIAHKVSVVRLIDLDTAPARLRAALQMHSSTQLGRRYGDDDQERLARRLETEALNELHLFLAYAYRLGYHKMLVYPYRPGAHRPQAQPPPRVQPAEPVTPDR
jgi:hypothetical protein